ncbi:MAG: tRNA uridine-5-carboxymethylaminomethyl(34) synthesis GTPase MnmE [Rhodobiaceae bacterium]|nr:MAG: tRNA uridine-5-carboxymethylaminomethyl(34) synthesis GTPase MnmE [Rhodobiaceae bacterium]PCJ68793.1 MAG: tRNA uridine-5-carboxymethylaminomethyl(34) synthesis GTPase MnmE [Rhodobiaceae bacterium]
METIFAPATARGRGGVAVVRVSGPDAEAALAGLSGRGIGTIRQAEVRSLSDPVSGELLDRALVLGFRGPHSFTGEDVVELHLHGGLAVVDSVIEGLGKIVGLRLAEPGEFTRRAVENGKFDLAAAEGIADLIEAETSAQRRQALRQMAGGFGEVCDGWRDRLIKILAYVEAEIDFADEDLPSDLSKSVMPGVTLLIDEISGFLADRRGEKIRDGIFVAVVGPPNVGKSSLVNFLARRDAVIVSEEAGTTRDVVEVRMVLGGLPVTICDTAGLREATGSVEKEGIRRARMTAEQADLRIWMSCVGEGKSAEDVRSGDLFVLNKLDMEPDLSLEEGQIGISVTTGQGLEALSERLEGQILTLFGETEAPVVTRERHRTELRSCKGALQSAVSLVERAGDVSLVAEELRRAVRAVGRITGRVDVEELLDVVFRDFCIGK